MTTKTLKQEVAEVRDDINKLWAEENHKDRKDLQPAINKYLRALAEKGKKAEVAELITTYVNPGHIATDYLSLMLNSLTRKPGDIEILKRRKNMKVRTLVPGSIHLGQEIRLEATAFYGLSGVDIKARWSDWDIDKGEIGDIAGIESEMRSTIKDHYIARVFQTLTDVWNETNTEDNHANVATAINATTLEAAIERINDQTGGTRGVFGSYTAMTPTSKFGAFWNDGVTYTEIPSSIEEVKQNGTLGRYYGAQLFRFKTEFDNAQDHNQISFPNDKILVIGENAGDFVTFGEVQSEMWRDYNPTPKETVLEMWQQYSVALRNAEGLYVITIT